MKILTLNLRAFGPFTDVVLDLSEGSEGLHVVYGPNEAGKTCALRALEQLLFGIPGNSPDNFVHPYPRLRIGARLRGGDGRELEFLRRKGTKNTLLGPDDQTPLDEAALEPFLGGLDRQLFLTMFGIDHPRLEQGGRDLAQGGGQLGQSLFSAGAGIANLRAVQEELSREADRLFKPGGSRPAINQGLSELKKARKAVRDAQLPSARWDEQDRTLRETNGRLAEVESRLADLARRKSRGERIRDALPQVARRREIRRQLADLGEVPLLPADFADQRRDADATLRAARKAEQTAREAVEQIDAQIESIVVPETLLAQTDAIERIHQALGSYRKAQSDRPSLEAQREQLEREARHVLRELDPHLTLDAVDRLRLTTPEKVEIQNLGTRHAALIAELGRAQNQIDESRGALEETERELTELPPCGDPARLKDAVRQAQTQGDLQQQLAEAEAELRRLEAQAAIDLEKLPLWSGALEALERLAVPETETVDRFEDQLSRSKQQLVLLREKRGEAEARQAQCEREIEQLRLEGEVPTEAEMIEARRLRDLGWQLVLSEWRAGEPNAEGREEFLGHFDCGNDLAAAYEHAVRRADELADRLRREANRVAQLAGLQASQRVARQQADEVSSQQTAAEEDRKMLERAWIDCWSAMGIDPLPPREMRSWLERQRTLASRAETIRAVRANGRQLEERIAHWRRELGQRLEEIGQSADLPDEGFGAVLGRSQEVVDRLQGLADRRERLSDDRARLRREVANAEAASKRAQEETKEWTNRWACAIEPLGLPPDSSPDAANQVLARTADLFDAIKQSKGLVVRIEGIDRDADRFRREVETLTAQLAPDLASLPIEQQAQQIYGRLQRAVRDDEKLAERRRERAKRAGEHEEARRTIDEQVARLDAMCQEARSPGHEALPEAIQRSEQAKQLRGDLARVDEELLQRSGGTAIQDFVAEVEAVDADALPSELGQLSEEIDRLEAERGDLRETRGRAQNALETMETGPTASEADEQKESLLARIETDARHYARLRLAAVVLNEAMERYRKKNEGPIIGRASALFSELTLGSFESLRTDVDSSGQIVLVGVRPGDTAPVHLDGMSEGTCDQLFLALRLASLENRLDAGEPIPLVVDDVLISFDDDRATAALGLLAEISRKTQVVFFTHHLHLVRLAEEHLEEQALRVHRLPERKPNTQPG